MNGSNGKRSSYIVWINRAVTVIGIAAFISLGITIVVSVFWRYVLNRPIFGSEDVATMCLSAVVASAIAYAGHQNGHITIDLMPRSRYPAIEKTRIAVATLVHAGAAVVLSYALLKSGLCGLRCGAITSTISIPHAPFYFFLAAALLLNAISYVVAAFYRWRDPSQSGISEDLSNSGTL